MFSSWLDISSRSYQMVSRALSSCRCSMFFKVAHLSCLDPGPETSDLETIVHVSRLLNFWILISKSTTWPEVMRRCIWSQFNKQHFGVIYCFLYIYIYVLHLYIYNDSQNVILHSFRPCQQHSKTRAIALFPNSTSRPPEERETHNMKHTWSCQSSTRSF